MSSIFSFLRSREEPPGEEPTVEPAAVEPPAEPPPIEPPVEPTPVEPPVEPALVAAPTLSAPRAVVARALTANSASTPDQALDDMVAALLAVLEKCPLDLPEPSVSVTSVTERAMAVGNRRGTERRGSFAVVELKGGRLDAVVRFQFLADEPDVVDAAVEKLHKCLLAAGDELWAKGFLRVAAEGTSLAEHISSPDAWRKTIDYRVLYEFHYDDTEGAESLIARIPIHSDPEERDSLQRETTVVTDEMVRWDEESALPLVVRGPLSLERLALLDYLPAPLPARGVTITRTFDGATGPPTVYPTLDDFLSAVNDLTDPVRHARLIYTTLSDFLEAFTDTGETIPLGDWDEDGVTDQYRPRALAKEFTNLAIDAVDDTKISSANGPFDSSNVGEIINISESAGFTAGRYRIMAVDASHVATLDRSCGTAGSTGGTGKIERIHILELPTVTDRLEIAFHGDALDQTGVMYLRAVRA